ncbi:hypothetical protein J5N58_01350 [Rhizobium cremeum]|uniref:hypothetical protein n=1 Tax=Rhizobium cremeum TaxID=2813827 RepID=UPI001FD5C5B1|nr:hypothetical protein [Rhizobium cremeum]MCJ7993243.1 hypothetical protein [Rhizobium cremeum]MCJ7998308.1 hypothetical protein [Rhizobium cremeum]
MSDAYLIAIGGKAPVEREANRKLHQDLIDDLSREAAALGWPGARFHRYGRAENYVSIEIVPGEGALSLDGLAAFREEQRKTREAEERQVA